MVAINKNFPLIMISAMYENGGNTTQRFLDGHPELFVYPFESQLGTKKTGDYLASFVPYKYRWPQYMLSDTLDEHYDDMFDEEVKIRVKIPHMSKFKDVDINLKDPERKKLFVKLMSNKERNRGNLVAAFFVSTFHAWKNYNASKKEKAYLGYSPVLILDADKIISDLPKAQIIHVVRNPFSAYAETKHRPMPLSLERYINTWCLNQMMAISFAKLYPKNVHIFKFENLVANPKKAMKELTSKLGISYSDTLLYPSWNGKKLENIYPWGTVQYATVEYNSNKANELSQKEKEKIAILAGQFIEHFDYSEFK